MGCRRTVVTRPKRQVCVGDLKDLVVLQNRAIQEPVFGDTDFTEDFGGDEETWASVRTVSGKTFFDQVNGDVQLTHEIAIRYDEAVTAETWVLFEDRRLDIVDVEDLEERHEWMLLRCVDRGSKGQEASEA